MQSTVIERAAEAENSVTTPSPLVDLLNRFLKHPTFGQPFRFGLVSACTTLVDCAVLVTLNHLLPQGDITTALSFAVFR